MKRILFVLAVSFVTMSYSQTGNDAAVKECVDMSITQQQILDELKDIRRIQDSTYNQRQRAKTVRADKENRSTSELAELDAMYGIKDNTAWNFVRDDVNIIGILAFLVAFATLMLTGYTYMYTKYTYESQRNTEDNTKKLSKEAQRHLLNELLRHLYRNYVITYTMRTKMKDIEYLGYPSEEYFEKMKIPMQNIHLEAFYGEDEKFEFMHVLYLNMRNYNEEIDVALKHITDPSLNIDTKNEDLDTLEFKVSYLTGRIRETIIRIWGDVEKVVDKDTEKVKWIECETDKNHELIKDMRTALEISLDSTTNATDNIDVPNSGNFDRLKIENLSKTQYAKLYSNEELVKVCDIFNNDVQEERKKNSRGAWKVRMIRW